jgi:protein-S-isoprenylcysteine O-methyltransferase Ste14
MHKRIFPAILPVQLAGLAITAAGLLIIRSGPYARLRHPIYSGILTALAGTELVYGQWRFIIAFVVTAVMFWYKAEAEEILLATELGAEFEEHRRNTGFLLPRLRPAGRAARSQS